MQLNFANKAAIHLRSIPLESKHSIEVLIVCLARFKYYDGLYEARFNQTLKKKLIRMNDMKPDLLDQSKHPFILNSGKESPLFIDIGKYFTKFGF